MEIKRNFLIIDSSKYPLVVATYQDFVPNADEFRQWQLDVEKFIEDKNNCVFILDYSRVKNLPVEYQKQASQWASRQDKVFVKKNIKTAMYLPSQSFVIMMKSLHFVWQPKATYYLVSDLSKAYRWAEQQLALMHP